MVARASPEAARCNARARRSARRARRTGCPRKSRGRGAAQGRAGQSCCSPRRTSMTDISLPISSPHAHGGRSVAKVMSIVMLAAAAGDRLRFLAVRLAGLLLVGRDRRELPRDRGGLATPGGRTGPGESGRRFGAADRLPARDVAAALGALVGRRGRRRVRDGDRQAHLRRSGAERVQPGDGRRGSCCWSPSPCR